MAVLFFLLALIWHKYESDFIESANSKTCARKVAWVRYTFEQFKSDNGYYPGKNRDLAKYGFSDEDAKKMAHLCKEMFVAYGKESYAVSSGWLRYNNKKCIVFYSDSTHVNTCAKVFISEPLRRGIFSTFIEVRF